MKKILWLIVIVPTISLCQVKYEIQEFTGTVKIIGHQKLGLAYDAIEIDVAGKAESFLFYKYYGKIFIENFKLGDQISVKVNINLNARAQLEKLKANATLLLYRDLLVRDYITEVKIKGAWVSLPERTDYTSAERRGEGAVFLDQRVEKIYREDGVAYGFVFKNGVAGNFYISKFNSDQVSNVNEGDILSFAGLKLSGEESSYPIPDIKTVYFFSKLTKYSGVIKSLLYKQNYACIGLVLKTSDGEEVKVSFPSNYATRISFFAKQDKEVTIYRSAYSIEKQLNHPELHGIVSGIDTLKINSINFYGGADGNHDHIPISISGKITKIERSANGVIISYLVDNNAYIEMTSGLDQIIKYIRKGVEVEITGDQRIKKEGEIYLKDFKIVTPRRIKIDGKEFILQ